MKFLNLLLLFCMVCPLTAMAQSPEFTLEQVMSSPFPTELTAASSTNRIA
jgi:hypothetical protein